MTTFSSTLLSSARRGRGASLVEVLVALVILAVGILGIIALQFVSKRNTVDSAQQTMASQLAIDLLERMRANASPESLRLYLLKSPHLVTPGTTAPTPNCTSSTSTCSSSELVAYDIWDWWRQATGATETVTVGSATTSTGGLMSPTVCVTGPVGGSSGVYSIVIAWRGGTALGTNSAVTCGAGAVDSGGARLYGSSDEYRRTLVLQAYIANI